MKENIIITICFTMFVSFFFLLFPFLNWQGFPTEKVKTCWNEEMIERRFGFDRQLETAKFAPSDHIIYTEKHCIYTSKPRKKPTESFYQYLKNTYYFITL